MKTIVITGGTEGIGRALAQTYLERGNRVVIVGATPAKGGSFLSAARDIRADDRASFVHADLSLIRDNNALVDHLSAQFGALDALVLGARYHRSTRVETQEGFESNFALFYLSRYLLGYGLRPLLEKAERPVIVNVAGPGGTRPIPWDDLQLSRGYFGVGALGHGGRLNDLLAVAFADKHAGGRTRYGLFHPGIVSTSFAGQYDDAVAAEIVRLKKIGKPVSEAAAPIISFIDNPPAAPLSAYIEGTSYPVTGPGFNLADARRLDGVTRQLLAGS